MLKQSETVVEAVAALLYNLIYEQDTGQGWTVEHVPGTEAEQRAFRAFAKALIQVLSEAVDDDFPGNALVAWASERVDARKAGLEWATIVIDRECESLPGQAAKHVSQVWAFLRQPGHIPEANFLTREERNG